MFPDPATHLLEHQNRVTRIASCPRHAAPQPRRRSLHDLLRRLAFRTATGPILGGEQPVGR